MKPEDQRGRRRFAAGAALRREAIAERPPFSDRFHERLLERLPAVRPPRPAPRVVAATSEPVPLVRRAVGPLAVSAAVVAVAALLMARSGRGPVSADQVGRPAGEAAALVAPPASVDGLAVTAAALPDPELGIDRLPTPGEIEAEVREGVATLAASLLEMPEWTALADFESDTFLNADGR